MTTSNTDTQFAKFIAFVRTNHGDYKAQLVMSAFTNESVYVAQGTVANILVSLVKNGSWAEIEASAAINE